MNGIRQRDKRRLDEDNVHYLFLVRNMFLSEIGQNYLRKLPNQWPNLDFAVASLKL